MFSIIVLFVMIVVIMIIVLIILAIIIVCLVILILLIIAESLAIIVEKLLRPNGLLVLLGSGGRSQTSTESYEKHVF